MTVWLRCCGLVVWVGGTIWVIVAARRARAARPTEVLPGAAELAGFAAAAVLFLVFLAIVIGYDLIGELLRKMLR